MNEKNLLTCHFVGCYTHSIVQKPMMKYFMDLPHPNSLTEPGQLAVRWETMPMTLAFEMTSTLPKNLIGPEELAARWKMKPITLAQWRWTGRGPRFIKMGHNTFYRIKDIEAYEEQKAKQSTTQTDEDEMNRIILESKRRRRKMK